MDRRDFIKATGAAAALAAAGGFGSALAGCGGKPGRRPAKRRVVVITAGGLDGEFLNRLMAEGKVPTLAAFAAQGTFAPLRTTTPAEAEVAWATFASGQLPDRHGVFGRFGRDPSTYRTTIANLRFDAAARLGDRDIWRARYQSNMLSPAFWHLAAAQGINACALWAPADFPPADAEGCLTLAGRDVPGAWLDAGPRYYYFSTGAALTEKETPSGGIWRRIKWKGSEASAVIEPPAGIAAQAVPVHFRAETGGNLYITVAGQTQRVARLSYSEYFSIPLGRGFFGRQGGLVRFFVITVRPDILMYMTPPEIDPRAGAVTLSSPRGFAARLARENLYGTRGSAIDIAALHDQVIGPGPLAAAALDRMDERRLIAVRHYRQTNPHLFLIAADGPGELGRVFWKNFDAAHPAFNPDYFFSYADAWEASYRALDNLVRELTTHSPGVAVLVVSPYGCRPFRRAVDLNRWLWENGYLRLRAGSGAFGVDSPLPEVVIRRGHYRPAIDWPGTTAHAQGYGQIYLNVKGRDRNGRVAPRAATECKDELRARLLGMRDGGKPVVAAVNEGGSACAGPRGFCAPDLLVSFAEGYRVSDESVTGGMAAAVIADNKKVVSGDAASMAAGAVPGLVLANVRLGKKNAGAEDIAPTVLKILGLEPPATMQGHSIYEE